MRPHWLPLGGRAAGGAGPTKPRVAAGGRGSAARAPAPPDGDSGEGGGGAGGEGGTPSFCGDGRRAPQEECDLGTLADQGCSASCTVGVATVDADDSNPDSRAVGLGAHPLAVSHASAALVFTSGEENREIRLTPFNVTGRERATLSIASTNVTAEADPVVAALDDGGFVVAFTAYGSDTTGPDVRLVRIAPDGTLSNAGFPGDTTVGSQRNPDLLALDDRLVVAWTDGFSDVLARELNFDLTPRGPITPVATGAELDDSPALARHGDGWALAFRQSADAGERIGVFAGGMLQFSDPTPPGADAERPALIALDEQRLLVVRSADSVATAEESATELVGSLFDLASGSARTITLTDVDGGSEHAPSMAWLGSRLLLSYQSEATAGDGLTASRAFVRELAVDRDTLRAGTPLRLTGNETSRSSAAPRVAAGERLYAMTWNESGDLVAAAGGAGGEGSGGMGGTGTTGDTHAELRRLFFPLPLADDSSYSATLPERAQ